MTNNFMTAQRILEQGIAAHRAGRLPEAEQSYRAVLNADPNHAEALYLLGLVFIQRNLPVEGEKLIAKSIASNPNQPAAQLHHGIALAGLRRFQEAVASFDRAIALKPDYVEALNNRGVALGYLGRKEEAVASFDQAAALRPDHVGAIFNRGVALLGLNRTADALASFDRVVQLKPDHAEAVYSRGKIRLSLNQPAESISDFDRAIALNRSYAEAFSGRAQALLLLGRAADAVADCDRAIALKPDLAEAFFNRGNVRSALQRIPEALADYDRAIALRPDLAEAFFNRANSLSALKRGAEAMADYDRALALKPDFAEAYLNRANALVQSGQVAQAVPDYQRVISLRPVHAKGFHSLATALSMLGRYEEALENYRAAKSFGPGMDYLQGAILRARMHICDWSEFEADCAQLLSNVDGGTILEAPFDLLFVNAQSGQQLRCAENHVRDRYPASTQALWRGEIYRHRKIRLAYLSGAFRDHPTTILMGGLFEQHDRARFETTALSFAQNDASPARLRLQSAFDRFIDVSQKADAEVAQIVRDLEIDILVDLDGFIGGARTGIMAQRAAPVQVNYLGYPGTMGATYIDYIIADRILIAADEAQHYSEKIVWLPDSYQPNGNRGQSVAPPQRAACGLPDQGFVFCCFNNINKLTPDVFDVWMRLLQQVPGSVLWLLVPNETARANLRREAQQRGIDAGRLIFASFCGQDEHLARQQLADLFLDTRYYNAHTTASDALWVELPLVTCRGHTFASRVGASLLQAAGLPELVADNLEKYEALALRLARDSTLLRTYRDRLARNRATCALFDAERFRRNLEAAYVRMWETAEQGEAPQSFRLLES